MKIDLNNPPDWLINNDFESVQTRLAVADSIHVPICNQCGTIMVKIGEGRIIEHLDDCPECCK